MKPFRYTGAADSCLWCADPLRVAVDEQRERTGEYMPPSACLSCDQIVDRRGERREWTELTPEEASDAMGRTYREPGWFQCKRCGNQSKGRERERIVSRTQRHARDRGGYDSAGNFCTLRCGYQFGMALANGGIQLALRDGKLVWTREG